MNATSRTALVLALALVAACSRPEELPDMGVSRTSLAFEAPGGSGDPAAQTVYVVNTGRGSLARPSAQVAYVEGSGWLSATVAGSGAPYAVAVQARVSALGPGVYHAAITLACGNASSSPVQVDVTLTVPDPRYTLSTASLTFDAPRGGADPAPQSFQVLNAGRGTLPVPDVAISYVGASGWLSTAVSGTPDAYTVTLDPRVAGLDSGTYTATLSISAVAAEGPPRTLSVTLNVPPAEIALSVSTLSFDGPGDGTDPAPIAVAVTNPGAGLLDRPVATVTYEGGYTGPEWLEVSVTGSEAPYVITVQPRQSHAIIWIPTGTYVATVHVVAPDVAESHAFGVTFRVPPPVIAFSNGTGWMTLRNIAGCPLPAPQTFQITNAGAGALERPTVALSDPSASSWLSVVVSGDDVPYDVTVTVVARPEAAQPGMSVEVALFFTAPGAALRGKTFYYVEDAVSAASVSISSAALSIHAQDGAGDPVPRKFQVTTNGFCSSALNVTVAYADGDPAWIQATATASGPNSHELVVSPAIAGLQPGGAREATVVVSRPESGWTNAGVTVTLRLGALAPIAPMAQRRFDHTMTMLPDGSILAAGGTTATYGYVHWSTEIWGPYGGSSWTAGPTMTKGRYGHGATLLANGDVLVCGGHLTTGSDGTCEALHAGAWVTRPPLGAGRQHPALVPLPDGKVLVASPSGGDVEIYDPSGGPSTAVPGIGGSNALKLPDGRVLVAGGSTARSWIYDPVAATWTPAGGAAPASSWPALVLLDDGSVLAVGSGYAGRWDPTAGTWRSVPSPVESHYPPEVVALGSGRVMAGDATGGSIEIFDPVSETWSFATVALPSERWWRAAVRHPSGFVVLTGGQAAVYPNDATAEAFIW